MGAREEGRPVDRGEKSDNEDMPAQDRSARMYSRIRARVHRPVGRAEPARMFRCPVNDGTVL
jgi:hypothetical protein